MESLADSTNQRMQCPKHCFMLISHLKKEDADSKKGLSISRQPHSFSRYVEVDELLEMSDSIISNQKYNKKCHKQPFGFVYIVKAKTRRAITVKER